MKEVTFINLQKTSITKIREIINESTMEELQFLIPSLKNDSRKGVQKILTTLNSKIAKYNNYLSLWELEESNNYNVIGCDEVGRGPIAGPVVAAAVTFDKRPSLFGLRDSKRLNERQREEFAFKIKKQALKFEVEFVDNRIIDEMNILNATKLAMFNSVESIANDDSLILLDGNFSIQTQNPQRSIVKGDDRCGSIAAASVLAKVYRDNYMREMDKLYPEYGFIQNKGYPTKEHLTAIKDHGLTPIHRVTFKGVK
ncbi:ribonuclease HII [Proteinivorax tanatarense]|uniref:Ribonuclease HII n=1 Tax=Proteinivorax tanatarense TaxID=1260629 RepID=A0AAU7VQ79_9FIRM